MGGVSCAKNHDIERRRAVVKLPRAREKERGEDTVCSVVHNIFSRDVISEIHTRETPVSYVTFARRLDFAFGSVQVWGLIGRLLVGGLCIGLSEGLCCWLAGILDRCLGLDGILLSGVSRIETVVFPEVGSKY